MDTTTSPPAAVVATHVRFRITLLPPDELDRIRAQGHDDYGNPLRPKIDEEGEPLRCCLRDARPGERIMLIAWSPFRKASPYAEVGPVLIHAERCAGYHNQHAYPDGFRGRPQIFRAYDAEGNIADAILAEAGQDQEAAIATLLSRPEVAFVHSRNVLYGCYMFQIDRD